MRHGLVTHVMLIAVLMVGCAKTPATTGGSAPAPTGSASLAASDGADGRMASATGAQSGTGSGGRVVPGEYSPLADLADIHFDFDRYDIRTADAALLDKHAAWLRQNPDRLVLIEGHCDERGTTEYNVALGERRAKATMNYLLSRGVPAGRLAVISYGEEQPACAQHAEGCWAQNRRAHFLAKRG
ncbi:MAG TPA: peptidoglycan-associated lipoprotein Pal [Candidatus Binatia bacterium]|nr:peptidoglycan-associated lipoprotein Pal [Candidatus Binatia bacterium]